MSTPRVSIVVRTKDRPYFLARALDSITSQTLTEWECVIVNDGGDAEVVAARIASLSDEDAARITVIDHPRSLGRWVAANAGILASTAEFIVLHDDDDTWDPAFLERAVAYLDANPEREGVVSRIEIVWEHEQDGVFIETGRELFQPQLDDPLLTDMLLFNRFVPIGFLYRRALHAAVGLYDDALPVVGDWDFNLKVLARGPLEYLDGGPLAYWHQRPTQQGHGANSVSGAADDHRGYDARIREASLREWAQQEGLGLALYLTKFIDQRFVDVENGIRNEMRAVSPPPPLVDRVRNRLRRSGKRD